MAMIGKEAKKTLENSIGLSMNQIYELDINSEIALVKNRTGRGLMFSRSHDTRKTGRGNPLLAHKKITTIEEINAKIDALQN